MAAGTLARPGTICGKKIGYDRNFYVVGSPMDLAHAVCLEDQADAMRAQAMETET